MTTLRLVDGSQFEDWHPGLGDAPCDVRGHEDHSRDGCPDLYALDLDIDVPEPQPVLSAGARLTARLNALVDAGVQPLTREPARPDLGTCGTCVHRVHGYRGYPKCDHPDTPRTSGRATDVRAKWPACHRHEARP